MALQKQLVPISFGTGIDTKVDEKQQVDGKFRSAVNTVFETMLLSKKRDGYDRIILQDINGDSVENFKVLTKFKNELNLLTNTKFYTYSTTRSKLFERGQVFNVRPTTEVIITDQYNQESPDCIFVENFKVIVWRNVDTQQVVYSVIDNQDGSAIISNVEVAAASESPRVVSIQNDVYITYVRSGSLYYKKFNILTPQTLGSETLLTNDINLQSSVYDVISAQNRIYIAHHSEADSTETAVFFMNASEVLSSISTISESCETSVDLYEDCFSRIIVTMANSTRVRVVGLNLSLLTALIPLTVIETISNVTNATLAETSADNYKVFYTIKNTSDGDGATSIRTNTLTSAGIAGTAELLLRTVEVASKPISINSEQYILAAFNQGVQSTYFLVNQNAKIAAKINPGNAGGTPRRGALSKPATVSSTEFLLATLAKTRLIVEDQNPAAILSASLVTLQFNLSSPYLVTQLGENSHIAGGVLRMYDGKNIVEHGFHVYPQTVRITAGAGITATTTGNVDLISEGTNGVREIQDLTFATAPGAGWQATFVSPVGRKKFTLLAAAVSTAETLQKALNDLATDGVSWQGNTLTAFTKFAPIYINDFAGKSLVQVNASNAGKTSKPQYALGSVRFEVTGSIAAGYEITFIKPVRDLELIRLVNKRGSGGDVSITSNTTGVVAEQAEQFISFIAPPEAGTWTITLGANTTGALSFNATAAQVKAALEALPSITTATVTGTMAEGFSVKFLNPTTVTDTMVVNSSLTHTDYGGEMTSGDRGYLAIYTWTDNFGQVHKSAPSEIVNFNFAESNSTQSARIKIPTLALTDKQNVNLEVFRTEDAGTVFYKVTDPTAPLINDPNVDFIEFIDGLSDDELISREPLYTSGGVLENIAAPACSIMTASSERLAIAGIDGSPYTVVFSKLKSALQPVEFSDTIQIEVDSVGGPITALAFLADKYIIFTSRAIFYVAGQGPNNLGQQNDFTSPEQIATDVGCSDQRSIVVTPAGLMFKSSKGIYLLDNNMSLRYIGAEVEKYNNLEITAAKVITDANQVRFTTTSPICLVYNYLFGLWSTFDNHQSLSAEIVDGVYYYLRTSEELFKQNTNSFADGDSPITMKIETGWLSPSVIQSYARVYKLLILGDFKSTHLLKVSLAYDFKEAYTQTVTVDPSQFIDATPYGGTSPYGTGVYGGNGNLYQIRIDLTQQKCQAIKIKIEELQATAGEGLSLSAMTLQVGAKTGVNKLPVANKFGTS